MPKPQVRYCAISVDGETYTYKYNLDGIRIEKTGGGYTHKYIVDGTKIAKELIYSTSTGHLLFDQLYYYDAHGYPSHARIIAYSGEDYQTETIYRFSFITNIQGDVVAIADNEGYCLIDFTYDAWGQCTTMRSPVEEESYLQIADNLPFRYRGYYMDEETGFYYLNSRYYDAKLYRFINADGYVSTGQGLNSTNMFAYCNNNPVMYVDPMGNFSWQSLASILTTVAVSSIVAPLVPLVIPTGEITTTMAATVVAVNHSGAAIEYAVVDANVKDTYTKEEADKAIEEITGADSVTFGDNNVQINDSHKIHSRYDRIKVSKIIKNTVDEEGNKLTNRTTYDLSAEWAGHNIMYNTWLERTDSTQHVNLDYVFDNNKSKTKFGTICLIIVGWL